MDIERFNELLAKWEQQYVEFKGATAFDKSFQHHLAISLVAMANTAGGGMIVVGVKNDTRQVEGLSSAQLNTFDSTNIANYVDQRFAPSPRFRVEHLATPDGTIVIIVINEFDEVPIVVTKPINDSNNKPWASAGDIFIRTLGCETRRVHTAEQMHDLVGRAVTKKGERLLQNIRSILSGVPIEEHIKESPSTRLATLLPHWATEYEAFRQRMDGKAHWEVQILPEPLHRKTPKQLEDIILKARVHIPPASEFPYYPTGSVDTQYSQHCLSATNTWRDNDEQWQFSYEGAFAGASVVWSELVPSPGPGTYPAPPNRPISFKDIWWSITEFVRFATNLVEILESDTVWINIVLHNVADRRLGSYDPNLPSPVSVNRLSAQDTIKFSRMFTAGELVSGWKEITADWIGEVYTVFQWLNSQNQILKFQQEFLGS